MNGYFSAVIDLNGYLVSFETDSTDFKSFGIDSFQKAVWEDGAEFIHANHHVRLGSQGLVHFSEDTFKLYKRDASDLSKLIYKRAQVLDPKSERFETFLNHSIEASGLMRAPLAFFTKDARICYGNDPLLDLFQDAKNHFEAIDLEIKSIYEIIYSRLFLALSLITILS